MEYDLLVIGGGSAGLSAAREAKKYVNHVALIENGPLGGTCVNLGCIPKKLFWFASDIWNGANALEAENWGINHHTTDSIVPFGWENFKQARDQYISRLSSRYEEHLKREGIERIVGKAEFCGERSIEIQTNDSCQRKLILNFKHAIIATGSHATIPKEIPGAFAFGKTSDDFFRLSHLPRKAAIIGFGYIGVEIAHLLASLGCETWIIGRGCLPLSSHFDHELSAVALSHLKATKNCHVLCEREISQVHERSLEFQGGDYAPLVELDFILFATGRSPNTAHLCCEKAKIELESERANAIRVDSRHQTTNARVFAVGDVIGRVMLTPVAISAARSIIKRLYASNTSVNPNENLFSYSNIPTVVFSHPPIGSVGLSEKEALKKFKCIFVYKSTFLPLQTSFGEAGKEEVTGKDGESGQNINRRHQPKSSFIKIITTGPTEQIIGIHLAGLAVDELLQGFAVALRMKATKADFLDCVAIHPTIAEEVIFTLSLKPLEVRSD